MQARGRKGQLLMDFEGTFGQNPTTSKAVRMPFISSKLQSKQSQKESAVMRNSRNPYRPLYGNVDVSGSLAVPLDKVAFGYWLKAVFGAPTTTRPIETGPYNHVFKPSDIQPSLVLQQGYTDIAVYELFNGCKINKLGLSFGGDEELKASIDIIGAKETVGSSPYASAPTDIFLEQFNSFQGSVEEGGSLAANIKSAELNIECNLDGEQYVMGGNGIRGDIPEGLFKISGSITALFENAVLLNKAINGVASSLKFKLTSGLHSLEFLLPEIVYEQNSPGIEGPKGILINLPFQAFYSNAVEKAAIVVTLINNQAAY